jgi:glycerophosphoryl diester phosphodiesterase
MSTPILVAHRGFASKYPENSLVAFNSALQLGVTHVECDVQLTRDLEPVIIHDDNLKRTAGIEQSVLESELTDLQTVSVHEPERFNDLYSPTPMPRLSDLVAIMAKHPDAHAIVEVKQESIDHFGLEQVMARIYSVLEPVKKQCTLISYQADVIPIVRDTYGMRNGWVLTNYDKAEQEKAAAIKPDIIICNHKKMPATKAALWSGAWDWFLYEIASIELAQAWIERGVKYIETMAVDQLVNHSELKFD